MSVRIIACGDVGAGKSTLIARLIDEGGTSTRQIIPAEAAAHEPRGTIDGISTADVVIVVIDARQGVLTQSRRHSVLASLLGSRQVVAVVNKMDLLGYSQEVFQRIAQEYSDFARRLGLEQTTCIPVSAAHGPNVARASDVMPWYTGPTVLQYLERVPALIPTAQAPPVVADQFEATVVWMHDRPLLQGRSYSLKHSTRTVTATVSPLKYRLNVDTLEHVAARRLELDEIGVCGLQLGEPIGFEPYAENPDAGGFLLLDRLTGVAVGAGVLHFALRRSQNVVWQALDVDKDARAALTGHKPCVVWFTGLSGAGKSTVANLLEQRLHARGCHTYLLDGDNVRHGLNRDLGFTDVDRVENIRRVAEVARLMVDAGLIVLVSFISPFRAERRMARQLVGANEFLEVFIDTPLDVAESRDPKGLYRKARRGELKNFTGVDSPYEPPEHAEVRLDTTRLAPAEAVDEILAILKRTGVLGDA